MTFLEIKNLSKLRHSQNSEYSLIRDFLDSKQGPASSFSPFRNLMNYSFWNCFRS